MVAYLSWRLVPCSFASKLVMRVDCTDSCYSSVIYRNVPNFYEYEKSSLRYMMNSLRRNELLIPIYRISATLSEQNTVTFGDDKRD